jgi:hypothetical protein
MNFSDFLSDGGLLNVCASPHFSEINSHVPINGEIFVCDADVGSAATAMEQAQIHIRHVAPIKPSKGVVSLQPLSVRMPPKP